MEYKDIERIMASTGISQDVRMGYRSHQTREAFKYIASLRKKNPVKYKNATMRWDEWAGELGEVIIYPNGKNGYYLADRKSVM